MGIQDRDYWKEKAKANDLKDCYYDPKQFRGGRPPRQPSDESNASSTFGHTNEEKERSSIGNFLVWALILAAIFFGIKHFEVINKLGSAKKPANNSPFIDPASTDQCVAYPSSGSIQRLSAQTSVANSVVEIRNTHKFPVVALFIDQATRVHHSALAVNVNQSHKINLPSGKYDLIVHSGISSDWCNLYKGFKGSPSSEISGGLLLAGGATTLVSLRYRNDSPDGFAVSISSITAPEKPLAATQGKGLSVKQSPDGHYYISGTTNGHPVVFLIDTGASMVSISSRTARMAGIESCTTRQFSTANGSVQGCVAIASELSFGPFRYRNIQVSILPNLANEALLGMNALSALTITHQSGTLHLSKTD